MQGQQKQMEQHAGAAEAERVACRGSRSRWSNMQGQEKQKEQHAGAAEAEGVACRGSRSR
jgi:hypothetical protein